MRLDIFLPFLRKPKRGLPLPIELPIYRATKSVLPSSLFADRATAKPGLIRKALKRIGPTWLSAPVRRVAQTLCFLLFLWLLFYVCYPYHAQPSRQWSGFSPQPPDANRLTVLEASAEQDPGVLQSGRTIHVSDLGREDEASRYLGPFTIVSADAKQILLRPTAEFSADRLEELRFDPGGPWTLSEQPPHAWPSHYTTSLANKEAIHAESLLIIDPLVAISTAISARTWVWSLVFAGGILVASVLVPRGFCGYVCPLGSLIDLFDWAIGA